MYVQHLRVKLDAKVDKNMDAKKDANMDAKKDAKMDATKVGTKVGA